MELKPRDQVPRTRIEEEVNPDLNKLVDRNRKLPEVENRYDDAKRANRPLASADQQFLEEFVSSALAMRTKAGAMLDKHGYLNRDAAPFRRSRGPVDILQVTSQPESVLLSACRDHDRH